jgi:RNA polymerase sigma-70 factor (ECF subfamily)
LENQELEQIIKDCSKGKSKAQEMLYRAFAPKMLGVCLRYSNDLSEAEDSLQDGFIKVFQSIKSYQYKGSFEGWIRRIMVNTALEKFRKSKNIQVVDEIWEPDPDSESEEMIHNADIPLDILLEMIQTLPDRYQMVFSLYVLDGYTHNEIAEVMNITIGTSKSNLARGRAILKQKVNEYINRNEKKLKIC